MIEPIELVDKNDPEKVIAYACGKCGIVCRGRNEAVAHCEPRRCDCGAETISRTYRVCLVCLKKGQRSRLDNLVNAATPICAKDYDGPVHWEQEDRYFENAAVACEYLWDDDRRGGILWPCSLKNLTLNAVDIITGAIENQEHHEEADAGADAEAELEEFIQAWNETHGKCVESWFPRYDEIVVIPQEWWDSHDARAKESMEARNA